MPCLGSSDSVQYNSIMITSQEVVIWVLTRPLLHCVGNSTGLECTKRSRTTSKAVMHVSPASITGTIITASLNPIPVDAKLDRWHIDIMGPFDKSKYGYQYLVVAVEAYSKWPKAFPLRTQESTEIANILFNYVFARYGAPRKLVSDKGQNFMSKLVLELCNMLNIKKYSTSPYHPQSNSTVERMNGTIQQSLRAYIIDNAQRGTTTRDWPSLLTSVLMGIRKSDCSQSTEHSPFYAMFGQEMNLPFDRAFIPASRLTADADEVIQTMVDNMKTTDTIIQDNLRKNQEKTKQRYEKKAKEPGFRLGDLVLLYTPRVPQGMSAKTHSKWSGPFYISEVKEKNTYTLRRWRDHKPLKGRVHANRLKKYHNHTQQTPSSTTE